MSPITHYDQFIDRVEELGFLPLTRVLEGLPSLSSETSDQQWHTGIPETDPWRWKDRAAEEKKLAYGCLLGGHKGFIAPRLYPHFYAACRPEPSLADRWEAGEVNQTVWHLWQLFEKHPLLDTANVRKLMGVTASHGAGRVDTALRDLQREFYITVAGSRRKIGADGQPYGWPVNVFAPVTSWTPPEWLAPAQALSCAGAREKILAIGLQNSLHVSKESLRSLLHW